MNPSESASNSKGRGYDKYRAWDQYAIDTGLKPEIDAKEFYKIFNVVAAGGRTDVVTAKPLPDNWTATHLDTLTKRKVQATKETGYYSLIWENGYSGSEPISVFENGRYEAINEPA